MFLSDHARRAAHVVRVLKSHPRFHPWARFWVTLQVSVLKRTLLSDSIEGLYIGFIQVPTPAEEKPM